MEYKAMYKNNLITIECEYLEEGALYTAYINNEYITCSYHDKYDLIKHIETLIDETDESEEK